MKKYVTDVRKYLVGIPLLYWDDTVVFINTARACMRFYGNDHIALYTAHLHKNLEGIMADNILPALRNGINEYQALLRLTDEQPFSLSEILGEA